MIAVLSARKTVSDYKSCARAHTHTHTRSHTHTHTHQQVSGVLDRYISQVFQRLYLFLGALDNILPLPRPLWAVAVDRILRGEGDAVTLLRVPENSVPAGENILKKIEIKNKN